jgi:putative transport protein
VELGDSMKQLNYPNILPVFIGIIIGVLLGSLPISIPGVPAPVKLGLAGGPLLVAIFFSRYARVGPVVWYLPQSANLILREVGIALFLACVGLRSGGKFVETLVHGDGFYWMALAALITIIPLLIVGFVARAVYKMNFLSVCGLLAGSMTDPPALSFANSIAASDAPSVTYATVYPLVMFLRILTAQGLVMFLAH